MTLTDFLLARIAEDEAVARAASPSPWTIARDNPGWAVLGGPPGQVVEVASTKEWDWNERGWQTPESLTEQDARHIARHDPERVLADCEARRRIVERHRSCDDVSFGDDSTCPELQDLAAVYSDHPDYRDEWKP